MRLKQKRNIFDRYAVLFLIPAFLLYTGFVIWPSITSLYYSLTNWNGVSPDITFVGFLNFKTILTSPRFWNALTNTFILTFVISLFENAIALALALLVDKVTAGKNVFRAAFYIPVLLSGIVSGYIWKILYNYNFGAINQFLEAINLGNLKQDWLGDPHFALISIAVVLIWKGAGYYMVIYLAALQGISTDVLEAARIDGASGWQMFRRITVPMISSAFTINLTLSLINGLKVFDQISVMTDGGPGFNTETMVYLLYKVGFGEGRQGYGTAVGIILFVIILAMNGLQNAILKEVEVDT